MSSFNDDDIHRIEKLISILRAQGVEEFSYEKDEEKIKLNFQSANKNDFLNMEPMLNVPAPMPMPHHVHYSPMKQETSPVAHGKEHKESSGNLVEIKSPFVGTFYRRPSPNTDPYVQAGDSIKKGKVLCIVEAMKLMNEIESDYSGVIEEVLVEDGQPVEFNEVLFKIKIT